VIDVKQDTQSCNGTFCLLSSLKCEDISMEAKTYSMKMYEAAQV